MTIISIAAKNIRRRLFRSITLILAVALVSGLLFAGAVSMKSVLTSIKIGTDRLGADLMIVPAGHEHEAMSAIIASKPSVFYMPYDVFEKAKKVNGVKKASPQLFIKSAQYECCSFVDTLLVAFDPETDFTVLPWLEGKLDHPLQKDEVILGRSIPVAKGDTMSFYGKALKVAGFFAETGLKNIDNGAYMTIETAREMIHESKKNAKETLNIADNVISTVLVQLAPEISAERAAVFIEYEIPGVKAVTTQEVIGSVKKQMNVLIKTIASIGVSLWIVTIVLIAVVFSMIVNERQREIGLLRSMGAKRTSVFSLILIEAGIISLCGGFAGIVAGWVILSSLKESLMTAFKLPYLWPAGSFIIAAGAAAVFAALLTGLLAAVYPALRSSLMEPYEAIRKGE
jgi:putative ABC transport system permease protein